MSSCAVCGDLKTEISSQRAFMAHLVKIFHEKIIYSMDQKFQEAERKALEFRKEVLEKLEALNLDMMRNVGKFGQPKHPNLQASGDRDEYAHRSPIYGTNCSSLAFSDSLTSINDVNNSFFAESDEGAPVISEFHLSGMEDDTEKVATSPSFKNKCAVMGFGQVKMELDQEISTDAIQNEGGTGNGAEMSSGITSFQNENGGSPGMWFAPVKLELLDQDSEEDRGMWVSSLVSSLFSSNASDTRATTSTNLEMDFPKFGSPRRRKKGRDDLQPYRHSILQKKRKSSWRRKEISEEFHRNEDSSIATVCTVCNVSIKFNSRKNIEKKKIHAATHLEIKRFKCSKCGSKFGRMDNATKHVHGQHSDEVSQSSARDLIVQIANMEAYQEKLASKYAECFPEEASIRLNIRKDGRLLSLPIEIKHAMKKEEEESV